MFRKEIKFIYDFNLNKVRKLGAYLTYEQIRKADIHPAILHYISAEIDYLIFEDRQKILKDSIFDYSGEKISEHFHRIGDEVKKNKRFSIEYIAQLILHSASFTVNYLARPRWALMKLIFEDDEHKSTTEIKQILNYVYYYGYLKKIITSYINRKKILSLNYNEFEDLLNKIDDLGFQSDFNVLLESALHSMSDFFNIGESNKHLIPLQCVELFVREKNLQSHLLKLRDAFPQDEKLIFDLSDYKKVFSSIRQEDTEEFEKLDTETPVAESTPGQDSEFIEEEIKIAPLGEDDDSLKIEVDDKDELIDKEFDELQKFDVSDNNTDDTIVPPEIDTTKLSDAEEEIPEIDTAIVDVKEESFNESATENIEDESSVPAGDGAEIPIAELEQGEENVTLPINKAGDEVDVSAEAEIHESSDKSFEAQEAEDVSKSSEAETSPPDDITEETPHADTDEVKVESEDTVTIEVHEVDDIEEAEELILEEVPEKEDELILVEEETTSPETIDEKFAEPVADNAEKVDAGEIEDVHEHEIKDDFIDSIKIDEEAESLIYDPVYKEKQGDETVPAENSGIAVEPKPEQVENQKEITQDPEAEKKDESLQDDLSLFESMGEIEHNAAPGENNTLKDKIAGEMFGAEPDVIPEEAIVESDSSKDEAAQIQSETTEINAGAEGEITEEVIEPDNGIKKIEVSELLERKNMTRVIEIIFDYDIEEFAYIIDKACSCENVKEAMKVLSKLFKNNRVSSTSKEAETLKSIISDYFSRKEN